MKRLLPLSRGKPTATALTSDPPRLYQHSDKPYLVLCCSYIANIVVSLRQKLQLSENSPVESSPLRSWDCINLDYEFSPSLFLFRKKKKQKKITQLMKNDFFTFNKTKCKLTLILPKKEKQLNFILPKKNDDPYFVTSKNPMKRKMLKRQIQIVVYTLFVRLSHVVIH